MPIQSQVRNLLLSRLSADDFALLDRHLEPASYGRGVILMAADAPLSHAFFLERGMASVVARSPEGLTAEAGVIGREGIIHPAVVLGADRAPHDVQMQLPDDAYRIASAPLLEAMEASTSLRRTLMLFVQAQSVQNTCTALSNAVHGSEERLARWILMCHDRVDGDELVLTQEFMSVMLAVRRPTVTTALHILEGNRLIRSVRGAVIIRDRAALEAFAADAYGKPEAEYQRLLGPVVPPRLETVFA